MGAIIVRSLKFSISYGSLSHSVFQIGIGIGTSWGHTIYKEFELLAGKSAPYEFIQLLIYKAATFSNDIEKIDTVRAYHVRLFSLTFRSPKLMIATFSEWSREFH